MEFDYAYADDDHHIDLRNPHFRREPMHYGAYGIGNSDMYAHHTQHPQYAHHLAAGLAVDVKPRLTKEQHDILEAHYQQQNKPNTQTKKGFAEALCVSLDKVNNWFQNRRAKSKQDAKKAAGSIMGQGNQSQPRLQLSTDDLSAQFLSTEYFDSHNDSAISVNPMALSSGLGISQSEQDKSSQANSMPPTTMSPQDLMTTPSHKSTLSIDDLETHRRTLTQEQFDSFAQPGDYVSNTEDKLVQESPASAAHSDLLSEYFPELSDFNFETGAEQDDIDTTEVQPTFSTESYGSSVPEATSSFNGTSTAEPAVRHASGQSSLSDWSDNSTPSLSVTPAIHAADSGYGESENDLSPRGKPTPSSGSIWQPGQSIPVDYQQMEREFREAALRSASQSVSSNHSRRDSSVAYSEQPLAFPADHSYGGIENPATLTQSMNNMEISNEPRPRALRKQTSMSSMSGAGGIAARRQRPRPQPLCQNSLRSASYCGSLPTAPGIPTNNNLAPAMPTLRRIKSSNVMNGIAGGRIQKNIGGQRSPLNFTFAEAMNSPKFSRRVSSYSPAAAGMPTSASLAPPTPLSPTELPGRLDIQRQLQQLHQAQQMTRQQSIGESIEENPGYLQTGSLQSNSFASPPTTPLYGAQFARNRLGMMHENTPPQSAPASQQCFPNGMYSQAPQMQSTLSQGPMLQSHPQSYMPVMANEYPQMPHMVMPSQQMHAGQYLEMMAAQQYAGMPQILPASQAMHVNYANMQYANGLGGQQITPPGSQYPFVPSSPGYLVSQQHQQYQQGKAMPAADFFVHEYSPPQDMKATTPRKTVDTGPKNYTFANHGPEHFEKSKSKDLTSSPGSSTGGSSTA